MGSGMYICRLVACLFTIVLLVGQVSGTLYCGKFHKTHELLCANNYGNSKISEKSRKHKFEPVETQSVVNHSASKLDVLREDVKDNTKLSYYSNGNHMPSQEKPLEYKLWRGKWLTTRNLTYSFCNFPESPTLGRDDISSAVASAFRKWADVVQLDFRETHDHNNEANINIKFMGPDHTKPWSFDGRMGKLAFAFPPEDGRFYLDIQEHWTVDMAATDDEYAVDLESVALHEIGHLIGLHHSKLRCSVMYSPMSSRQIKHHLTCDDIEGAMVLYGPRISEQHQNPYVGPDGKFKTHAGCLDLCHKNDADYDPDYDESISMLYFSLAISFIILIFWFIKCFEVRRCFNLLLSLCE